MLAVIFLSFVFGCTFIERSSTRLFAPPGGKTSISFGGDDAPATNYPVREKAASVKAPVQQNENVNPQPQRKARGYNNTSSISFGDDVTPAFVRPTVKSSAPAAAPAKDANFQQPSRGRQPPGGHSSITF